MENNFDLVPPIIVKFTFSQLIGYGILKKKMTNVRASVTYYGFIFYLRTLFLKFLLFDCRSNCELQWEVEVVLQRHRLYF